MTLQAVREDNLGLGRERVGGQLADAEFAEDWEEGAGEKDGLAGPPLPPVRGVTPTSAAQETYDNSLPPGRADGKASNQRTSEAAPGRKANSTATPSPVVTTYILTL